MFKATTKDFLLIGITEDNLQAILKGDPLYTQNDEIDAPFDIQIALEHTLGIAIEGRSCLTCTFTKKTLESFRTGYYRVIEKTPHTPLKVMIFYGRTLDDIQSLVNEGLGVEKPLIKVPDNGYHLETVVDGVTVVKRGKAMPSIFRNGGKPWQM